MSDCTTVRIGRKKVAVVRGDLLDIRRHSSGFLTTPPGIAISVRTIEQARGCQTIKVTNLDSGTYYTLSMSDFLSHAWTASRGGYEKQYLTALDVWEPHYKHDLSKVTLKPLRQVANEQMTLF